MQLEIKVVFDHSQHESLRLFHEHDLDHSARIAELDGIVQKIQERMHQQILVAAVETRVFRRLLCHQNALFAGRTLDALQGFGHHVLQRKGQPPDLLSVAFQTRDIQKVPKRHVIKLLFPDSLGLRISQPSFSQLAR